MQSPKQIIEKIRKIRFGIGLDINNTSEDVRAHIEDNKKFKDDASRLASDLHTEKPHFILELIQNAEDNDYYENVKPTVKFIIQEDKLILQNNEKGFEEKNVWALCGVGETTKKNKKAGYIGEKGIGFKSVFMVTSTPYVYSKGFQFKFNYDEKNPITIIIPHWVDDVPHFVDSNKTNIVLLLKDEVKDKLIKFTEIDPCLLLFLRKLRHIEIEDKIQNKTGTIERQDSEGKIRIVHPGGQDYWRIVKIPEPLKVPSHIKEEKRKDIIETEIVLAFPLTPDGSAETSTEQKIFVYLPVRSYGFKFIIQADFLMPPSREDIHKDESDKSWNKWLRDNIASIFSRAVEEFKLDEKLKKTFYNYIPLTNEVTDTFFSPVVEQIQNNLRNAQCILTDSKNWLKPVETFRADNEIRALISNDDLKELFDKEYISSDIKANKQILDALEVPEFGFNHLVQCLQKEEWLKKQSDEWFTKLYTYLSDKKLKGEQIQALKNLKIIRLENNELASTFEEKIFFPLDKRGDYGFEKEIRVIKRELLEIKKKETKEAIVGFLKSLDICDAQPYQIIENHILPMYESDDENHNWKRKDAKLLLGYIRYIKDNLQSYEKESDKQLNANKKLLEKKEDPLKRLKKSLYIRINKTVDSTNYYERTQNIYLPKTFGNENNLESLFEGVENVSFVHREYIDEIIKKYRLAKRKGKKSKVDIKKRRETEIEEWGKFFVKLGVNEIPPIISNRQGKVYSCEPIIKIVDILEQTKNTNKIKIFLKMLDENWDYYHKYLESDHGYEYHKGFGYYGWQSDKRKTDFYDRLLTAKIFLANDGGYYKPSEVFLDKPDNRELLGDTVPYLTIEIKNKNLVKILGINSEANAEGVLNYLKSLTEQKCEDKTAFTKLYEFLNKNYENNKDLIDTAFSNNRIIYLPDTTQRYFRSKEVLWKDVSDIFGENRGYLEKHYPKLRLFFMEKLDVSEKPSPKDYANVLMDLTQKEKVGKEDENIILKIYKELNNHLNPEDNEHLISEEEWWNNFISKPIFWTDKEEFWKNDNDVFVNDNQELYKLFKDNPKISFLKLPKNYHPQIQFFIEATHISYLSKIVKIELASKETPRIEQHLTNYIRDFVPYILRYLYQLVHPDYERLKRDGTLTQLKNLTCYSVENLNVNYCLGSEKVFDKRNSLLYNANLYIQKDRVEDTDYLAIELSKLFGDIRGLDDFLISLFDKKNDDKIENLLEAKGIQELPDDEQDQSGIIPTATPEVIEEARKDNQKIIEIPPSDVVSANGQINPKIVLETPKSQVPPIDIGSEGVKTEWYPIINPMEAEARVEQFQPTKTGSKVEKDNLPVTGTGHGITQQITSDEEKQDRDTLSPDDKKAIGRWGEEYTINCLKDVLCKKYSKGELKETEDGFAIICDDQTYVEVHWLNKIKDKGEGYDIKVIENGNEEYIEVKSTKTEAKEWFDMSSTQWKFVQEKEDKFHIYRIYNAGTNHAKLVDIPNPKKLWQEGGLIAYPIRVQI